MFNWRGDILAIRAVQDSCGDRDLPSVLCLLQPYRFVVMRITISWLRGNDIKAPPKMPHQTGDVSADGVEVRLARSSLVKESYVRHR